MTRRLDRAVPYLILAAALTGCDPGMGAEYGLVSARDLAGTYTGVLEGVSVASLGDLEDPQRQVIVDIDLLHPLTIRETGPLTVRIESAVIPPLRAVVLGVGPVAINAEFVEFEGLDLSGHDPRFTALKVKQIVFVQYEGEWIVVLQLVRVGVAPQQPVDSVYVYQYVSYPAAVARQMEREDAIRYVNTILRLLSSQ